MSAHHLAPPERVSSEGKTYVVWVQSLLDGSPQNVGQLQIDDSLTGTLSTITPLQTFDVFITVETSATTPTPTGEKLLWARHN